MPEPSDNEKGGWALCMPAIKLCAVSSSRSELGGAAATASQFNVRK